MNPIEAKWLLLRELVHWRRRGYKSLALAVGEAHCFERISPSGAEYQIELQVLWDDHPQGDVRILASIDDGGWRAWWPLSCSTIVAPPDAVNGD